jgi:hypothetical protein
MGQNELQAVELEMVMGRLEMSAGSKLCALSCSITWHRKLIREAVCWGSNASMSALVTWRTQLQSGGDLMNPSNCAQVVTSALSAPEATCWLGALLRVPACICTRR